MQLYYNDAGAAMGCACSGGGLGLAACSHLHCSHCHLQPPSFHLHCKCELCYCCGHETLRCSAQLAMAPHPINPLPTPSMPSKPLWRSCSLTCIYKTDGSEGLGARGMQGRGRDCKRGHVRQPATAYWSAVARLGYQS